MSTRKLRVEVSDGEGNKYTVSFEGQITRDKAVRLLDLVELLGGVSGGTGNLENASNVSGDELSKYEKARALLHKNFPLVWFSSRDVQLVYEQEFKEPISLSTVSTYLARMTDRGFLVKAGSSKSLKYKLVTNLPQTTPKQQIS